MNRFGAAVAARVTGGDVSGIVAERSTSGGSSWGRMQDHIVIDTLRFRPSVLDELARHGLQPGPATTVEQLRDAVRDLYRYEIRRLRSELLAGRIRKPDYASRVAELRGRYPLLSLPVQRWVKRTENTE
jgi:hypothetical protein